MVSRNAGGVFLPALGHFGFAFRFALLLIRADQYDFRANRNGARMRRAVEPGRSDNGRFAARNARTLLPHSPLPEHETNTC